MAHQVKFERNELKYLITLDQKNKILETINQYMLLDNYGRTIIRNIYFDTPDYRLIRRSIEKPIYKEKLRIRSYKKAEDKTVVFVEVKKKYDSIVYKRRIGLPIDDAMEWICKKKKLLNETQISREIEYFVNYYKNLQPTVFLTYEREAYYCKDNSDLRITFDENILYRDYDIDLHNEVYGEEVLDKNYSVMEIKCSYGMPLWLTALLSKEKIFKTSFSKYGTAYKKILDKKIKGE